MGQNNLRSSNDEVLYVPLVQRARTYIDWQIGFRETMIYAVRTNSDPRHMIDSIRRKIKEFDPDQPVGEVRTMQERVTAASGPLRPAAWLLGIFSGIALVLALVGVYGMLAFYVERRKREIGIRMALGALPRQVIAMTVGAGMVPVLLGLAIGLAGALAVNRVVASLLFGTTGSDSNVYILIAVLFLSASLVAAFFPARRASLIDPMRTLRAE